MVSNLLVAFKAVAPVFVLIAVGMLVRRGGVISEAENNKLNKMVFLVFFPPLMIHNMYNAHIAEVLNFRLITFGVVMVLVAFVLTTWFVVKIEPEDKKRGAMIQAIYRSNFVILGIPIVENIFPEADLGVTAMMIAFVVPIYNVLAVSILEVFRGGKISISHLLSQIAKNPIIIGSLTGIIISATGIKLPYLVEDIIADMAGVTTPLALVILGISFEFSQIKKCGKSLWIAVVGRLIVIPMVALTLGALMGFRGVEFVTLIAIFASPAAVSSYTMAVTMDSDSVLAGNAVIMTSLISSVTMFLWIFIFKSLGMF